MLALHAGQRRAKVIHAELTFQPNETGYIHLGYLLDGEQFPFHDLPLVIVDKESIWTGIVFRSRFAEKSALSQDAREQRRHLDSLLWNISLPLRSVVPNYG
jgi:hypothetical protein